MERYRGRYHPRYYHRKGGWWQKTKDWVRARVDDLKNVKKKIEGNPLGKKALEMATEKAKEITNKAHDKIEEKIGKQNTDMIESVLDEGVKEVTGGKVSLKRKPSTPVARPKKRRRKVKKSVFDA